MALEEILKDIPEWDVVCNCVTAYYRGPPEKIKREIKAILIPKILFPDDLRRMHEYVDVFCNQLFPQK